MTDALGLTILVAEVQRAPGINQQTISLVRNKYSSGIYLVRIITEGKIMVEKLVVE